MPQTKRKTTTNTRNASVKKPIQKANKTTARSTIKVISSKSKKKSNVFKFAVGLSVFALLLVGGVFVEKLILANSADAANKAPVVYFVPHQDDETLTMGASIAAHAIAGRDVNIVLVTDGSSSGVRTSTKFCEDYSNIGINLCTETPRAMPRDAFTAARNREFVAALAKLGVPANKISYENIQDGTVTSPVAEKIIDKYIAKYPKGTSFKAFSWLDAHEDHSHLGSALNNRCINQKLDCRFYQSSRYQAGTKHPEAKSTVVAPKSGKYGGVPGTEIQKRVQAAANVYLTAEPSKGLYAIGGYSVKRSLEFVRDSYYSMYHLDNNNWKSTADRNAATAWIKAQQTKWATDRAAKTQASEAHTH